ncbi:RNA polymerase II elongation factor ELL [Melanaphis sacchari]|uniref:RNA polymerase II elongation factor ELL n=1 Tax=Melanaphis sacchari TaxID=742174 RepID=UPI000DC140DB|nr:RNA polymerase II elongation factor ELL [Melanaphis sacchari]
MSALTAGVQYSLSSNQNNGLMPKQRTGKNKTLFFVKLTDSCLKAVEDYLRCCQQGNSENLPKPRIQFKGNEGQLCVPSISKNYTFDFSLSNNDVAAPRSSFECIRQNTSRSLEYVGTLNRHIRVLANDDVYEATRHRMVAVEELHKKSCTREIELDSKSALSRKIRKNPAQIRASRHNNNTYNNVNITNNVPKPIISKPIPPHTPSPANHASDISKKPLRDRIIHLLALRPYKKPELISILNRDGLKDKDRTQIMSVLSHVAQAKDNVYYLLRHIWNDVQEDWPFYSSQDHIVLKRRKPQNLTPPGLSDTGSSGSSEQSPSSTVPSSPPNNVHGNKRPGYYNSADGFQTKRLRISHFKRPSPEKKLLSNSPPPIVSSTQSAIRSPTHAPSHTNPIPKYIQDFVRITNKEQKKQYKSEFMKCHKEYKHLAEIMDPVRNKFAKLKDRMLLYPKGSNEYKILEKQILQEYNERKHDDKYQAAKTRFDYLHNKLSHIKDLVHDYDKHNPVLIRTATPDSSCL